MIVGIAANPSANIAKNIATFPSSNTNQITIPIIDKAPQVKSSFPNLHSDFLLTNEARKIKICLAF